MPQSRHRKKPAPKRRRYDRLDDYDEPKLGVADVIGTLIEPYASETTPPEEVEKLFMIGTVAWNVSLLPPEEREQAIHALVRDLCPPPRFRFLRMVFWAIASRVRKIPNVMERVGYMINDITLKQLIREMIDRKERLFPNE